MPFKNLDKVKARINAIPGAVKEAVQAQLDIETDGLVEAIKAHAPVSDDLEKTPGELRDSVHKYANPDRDLSYRIIADAKDEKGRNIGSWVEHGHKTHGGRHVPAQPFFFPTYRSLKKPMRRRMLAAGRKAVKAYTVTPSND